MSAGALLLRRPASRKRKHSSMHKSHNFSNRKKRSLCARWLKCVASVPLTSGRPMILILFRQTAQCCAMP
eukprot:2303038-Pyramimonas_sp.AAC.1